MSKKFRVRRTHPDSYAQNQATTMPECKYLLDSLQDKWDAVVGNHNSGFGYDFRVERKPRRLTVYKQNIDTESGDLLGETITDEYVIEDA